MRLRSCWPTLDLSSVMCLSLVLADLDGSGIGAGSDLSRGGRIRSSMQQGHKVDREECGGTDSGRYHDSEQRMSETKAGSLRRTAPQQSASLEKIDKAKELSGFSRHRV